MAALGLTHYPQFLTTQLGLAPQLSSPCSASLGTRDDDNGDVAASEPIAAHLARPSRMINALRLVIVMTAIVLPDRTHANTYPPYVID